MALDRFGVAGALVPEQFAAPRQPLGAIDQPRPVVVADLVAEMTEDRPVGLAEVHAHLLPEGVVRLGDVEGDDAIVVAGEDLLVGLILLERERQPPPPGLYLRLDG